MAFFRRRRECRRWTGTYSRPVRCRLDPDHPGPCQPFRLLDVTCQRCGAPMRVAEGSAPDLERVCNLCVYAEIAAGR